MSALCIAHPEWMDIPCPGGAVSHGANQDWFPEEHQRRAGCGPTTAAQIFCYLARRRPELAALCDPIPAGQAEFVAYMCRVWPFVTPRSHGLNRPEYMAEDMAAYGAARGVALAPTLFAFPSARTKRPPWERLRRFVAASLAADCPVAFLNLDNGKIRDLDRWHWVTIVGLEGEKADLVDNGRAFAIDLQLWYATTKTRGGFVAALGTGEALAAAGEGPLT